MGGGNNRVTARDKFRSDVKPVMSQSRMEHYPARHQHEGEERISGTGWNKSPESEERIEWLGTELSPEPRRTLGPRGRLRDWKQSSHADVKARCLLSKGTAVVRWHFPGETSMGVRGNTASVRANFFYNYVEHWDLSAMWLLWRNKSEMWRYFILSYSTGFLSLKVQQRQGGIGPP